MAAARRALARAGLVVVPSVAAPAFGAAPADAAERVGRVERVARVAGGVSAAALAVDLPALERPVAWAAPRLVVAALLEAVAAVPTFAADVLLAPGVAEPLAAVRDVAGPAARALPAFAAPAFAAPAFAAPALGVPARLAAGVAAAVPAEARVALARVAGAVAAAGAADAARRPLDRAVPPLAARAPPVALRAAPRTAPTAAPAAPSATFAAALAVLRAAPVADLVAFGSFGSFFAPLTTSLKLAPGLNFGTAVFFSLTVAPVAGLRPVRAGLSRFSKEPKPVRTTRSPFATVRVTVSSSASTAVLTVFLSTATRSVTASMSSDLFTPLPPHVIEAQYLY